MTAGDTVRGTGLPGAGGPRRRTLLDQLSSNPSGSQTFYTDARGAIYNDGSGGGSVQYFWFHTISPSQNY